MLSQDLKRLLLILRSQVSLPEDEAIKAGALFQPCYLQEEEYFIRAGELPTRIGIVLSGILQLYYVDLQGNHYTKSFCVENSFVAAYSSLLLAQPSQLFIQAIEDAKLLTADYAAYRRLSAGHACWQSLNCKIAENLFIKKEKREASLLLQDATARYLAFRTEYPGLESRIKQHQIASYLGISPVTLSRIRAQLKPH